ncbi:MAG: hypothetical protein AAFO70_07385 [Pseudomonadota bacterium]
MFNRFAAAALVVFATIMPAQAQDRAALNAFVDERLTDAIRLMDAHFRIPETGQYRDAIRIGGAPEKQPRVSSIAATGIGLMSLAMGDALGVVADAEAKAIKTLRNLLNRDATNDFSIYRSANGWYPHFIDGFTGERTNGSQEKVSTIDTALLAAGTAIAARYFSAKSYTSGQGESRVFMLGGRVVGGVRWRSAIRSVDRGLIHLVFKGDGEEPLMNIFANPFDEYAMLPCITMRGEQLAGREGKAHDLFMKHYDDISALPFNDFEGIPVLGKRNGSFIAHFTHQFAYYFCNAFSGQNDYRQALRDLARADRAHFVKKGFDPTLWGIGAGAEVKFKDDGTVQRTGYGVVELDDNEHDTASPAIMAGFAPLWRPGREGDPVVDLKTLWEAGTCRYAHQNLGFLWRCSAREPQHKVRRVEAIDFSTYIMGLAGRHPKLGIAFFRHFNL